MNDFMQINPKDNVAVALSDSGDIPFGHKKALRAIAQGESIIKYGYPIGIAVRDIQPGEHVHTHNLKTALGNTAEYSYSPCNVRDAVRDPITFMGYDRGNGKAGIRNEIWVLPTVGCVNKTAERLCQLANERFGSLCDGFFAFTHPYGCSQLGDDQANTQKILAGLARHPNAAGVLLLSLGCENNNLDAFLPVLGDYDRSRIRSLVTQDCEDEIEEGLAVLRELGEAAKRNVRTSLPVSMLTVGFKCGGSDAFSGITANPLCGRLTDLLTSMGGRVILTEVPEMFGAETILMRRAENREVFESTVDMINGFKDYFVRHGQVVYENPSPGNKKGGITTLEEKSLGCIQKGGSAVVRDVLGYGAQCVKPGLSLLTGPGNDIVSCTNLTASGANIILFTTGRGTPLGAPVPTVKIATNSALASRKPGWTDYDAGCILTSKSFEQATDELMSLLVETASGRLTRNEENGYKEIAVFKDGVTL